MHLDWRTPRSIISAPHRRNLGAPRAQEKNWLPATVEPAYNTPRSAYLCLWVRWPVDTRGSRRTPSGPPFYVHRRPPENQRQGSNKDGWRTGKTSFRKPVSHAIFVEREGGIYRKRTRHAAAAPFWLFKSCYLIIRLVVRFWRRRS